MTQAIVYVTYKDSILDPQGEAVKLATHKLGYPDITDVRIGKFFEIQLDADKEDAQAQMNEIAEKLLANPSMERYRVELVQGGN